MAQAAESTDSALACSIAENGDVAQAAAASQPPPQSYPPQPLLSSASPLVPTIRHRQTEEAHEIVPGVEHKFFEEELEKMEHQQSGEGNVVILAVDGSPHSDFAFEYYVKEVHRPNYTLHLVHCSEIWVHMHQHEGAGPDLEHMKSVQLKEENKVKEMEEKYNKLLKDNQINGVLKVVGGKDAWHGIIDYQEKSGAIMIVVGNRGSNAIRRTLMGSVSDSIVHHAHCPVLVCKHHSWDQQNA